MAELLRWFDHHGSGISAVAAIFTAVIAVAAIVITASDSRRRSQPVIIAEVRPAPDSDTTMDLVVRNAGATVARDVRVTFDPAIEIPEERKHESLATEFLIRRYRRPIPTLSPGQELSNTYWLGVAGPNGKRVNGEPTPDEVTVTVEYRGIGRRQLRETYIIDMDIITLATWTVSSESTKGRLKAISESLKKIANAQSRQSSGQPPLER